MEFITLLKEKLLWFMNKIKSVFTKKASNDHVNKIQNINFNENIDNITSTRVAENRARNISTRESQYSCNNNSAPSSPICYSQVLLDPSSSTNPIIFPQSRLLLHTFSTDSLDQDVQSIEDIYNLVINKLQRFIVRSNLNQLSTELIKQQLHNMHIDLNEFSLEDLLEFKNFCINSQQHLNIITYPLTLAIEDFLLSSNENYVKAKSLNLCAAIQAKLQEICTRHPERITLNIEEINIIFTTAHMDLNILSLESLRKLYNAWDNHNICNQLVKFTLGVKISSRIREKIKSTTNHHLIGKTKKQVNFEGLFAHVLTSIANSEPIDQSKKFYQEIFKNLLNINDNIYINVDFAPNKWINLFDEYYQYNTATIPSKPIRQEIFEFQQYLIAVDAADSCIPNNYTIKSLSYWIDSISSGNLSGCLRENLVAATLIYAMINFLLYKYLPKTMQNSPLLVLQELIELTLSNHTEKFASDLNIQRQYKNILQSPGVNLLEATKHPNMNLFNYFNQHKQPIATATMTEKNLNINSSRMNCDFH